MFKGHKHDEAQAAGDGSEKKKKGFVRKIKKQTSHVLRGGKKRDRKVAKLVNSAGASGGFMDKAAVSVVLCVHTQSPRLKAFAYTILQRLRSRNTTAQILSVKDDAAKMPPEDQMCLSRCITFCPLMDLGWFGLPMCTQYYQAAVKCARKQGLVVLPLFIFSAGFGVRDARVQLMMKNHECLYAKLEEVTGRDVDTLADNIIRSVASNKRLMETQVESQPAPKARPVSSSSSNAPRSPRSPRAAPSAAPRTAVSVLLTMTEGDLSMFGMMGSPGTQLGGQLHYGSILDLLNIYETHRFHLEKAAQVLQTLAPFLRAHKQDRDHIIQSKWLQVLSLTHEQSQSTSMKEALRNVCAACDCEVPARLDPNQAKMEVLVNASRQLQADFSPSLMLAAIVAAALRHVAWNSANVKTQANSLKLVTALCRFVPAADANPQPSKDNTSLATVLLAIGGLVLDPLNKLEFRQCGGINRVVGVLSRFSDDMVVSAGCACLASLVQGKTIKSADTMEMEPACNLLLQALPSNDFISFLTRVAVFLDTPSRSLYAAQLLDLVMQGNAGSRHLIAHQGALDKIRKILRYCLQTRPLTYGSAVLCRKMCGCLKQLLVDIPQHQAVWVKSGGCRALVILLDHKGYRNPITLTLQEVACQCLLSVARNNLDHVRKIGEEGGVRRVLAGIKGELEEGKRKQQPDAPPLVGKSVELVSLMLTLLTTLCMEPQNKTRVADANGISICLALLDSRQSSNFLEQVLDTLEVASFTDANGEFVGWTKEDILTLAKFAGKSGQPPPASDGSGQGKDGAPPPAVPPRTGRSQVVPPGAFAPPPSPAESVREKATALVQSDALKNRLSQAKASPADRGSGQQVPVRLASDSGPLGFTMPTRRHAPSSGVGRADVETPRGHRNEGEEAARRLGKMLSDMHQIARELGVEFTAMLNDPAAIAASSSSPASPAQKQANGSPAPSEEVAQQKRKVESLTKQLESMQARMAEEESQIQQCEQTLAECDQEMDTYQEEIAATDLSLLLMEESDALDNDELDEASETPSDLHEDLSALSAMAEIDGEEGMVDELNAMDALDGAFGVAEFGRDEEEEGEGEGELDEENVQDYRNQLVDELEKKKAERAQVENQLMLAEENARTLNIDVVELRARLEDETHRLAMLGGRLSSGGAVPSSPPSSANSGAPQAVQLSPAFVSAKQEMVHSYLERIGTLKSNMLSEIASINKHFREFRLGDGDKGQAAAGAMPAPQPSAGDNKAIQALMAEHAREKKKLLEKLHDAEEKAEAFSMKVVDEHKAMKQMKLIKTQKEELKLSRALGVRESLNSVAVVQAFTKWRTFVYEHTLEDRASEIEIREQVVARSMMAKELEMQRQNQRLAQIKLQEVLLLHDRHLRATAKSRLTQWRLFVVNQQGQEERNKIGQAKLRTLETCMRTWQLNKVANAFRKWHRETQAEQSARHKAVAVAGVTMASALAKWENHSLRRAFHMWEGFVLRSRVRENQMLLFKYEAETQQQVDALNAAQAQAEARARQLAQEKQMSQQQALRMRQELETKRAKMLGQCIRRIEHNETSRAISTWRKWTRAQIRRDMEMLQSMLNDDE